MLYIGDIRREAFVYGCHNTEDQRVPSDQSRAGSANTASANLAPVSVLEAQCVIKAKLGDFDLWFQLPAHLGRVDVADPFVAAALLPAMKLGVDIQVEPGFPLSYRLSQGLTQLQDIYTSWRIQGPVSHFPSDGI
ncbi:hypothetical protein [Congregibacter sp.]|jgi:hypothetical protein|uniref:hypothetical protein n=1 Tax=Congregibacter sp. TaxID=2744308 RepID=UPI0039E60656